MEENVEEYQKKMEIRSTAVQEIFGHVPHWMIRWGNMLIFFLVIGMFLISYLIKYPNSIGSEILLTTTNPPKNIYAAVSGQFLDVLASEGTVVSKGEKLAVIKDVNGEWEEIKSPINGKVYFLDFWKKDAPIDKGNLLFKIFPSQSGNYIGKLSVSSLNLDKITKGQKVMVHLTEDLFSEQDVIEGAIHKIATVANDSGNFAVEVTFSKDFLSPEGKKINLNPGTRAQAEIITEDLRIIERFFYQLKDIFKSQP